MSTKRTKAVVLGKLSTSMGGTTVFCLFTKEFGKLYVRVRGIGKPKSKTSQAMSGCHLLEVDCYEGKGRMPLLTMTTIATPFPRIMGDMDALEHYWMLVEVLSHVLPDSEQEPEVFDLVTEGLASMNAGLDAKRVFLSLVSRVLVKLGHDPYAKARHEGKLVMEPMAFKLLRVYAEKPLAFSVKVAASMEYMSEVQSVLMAEVETVAERKVRSVGVFGEVV